MRRPLPKIGPSVDCCEFFDTKIVTLLPIGWRIVTSTKKLHQVTQLLHGYTSRAFRYKILTFVRSGINVTCSDKATLLSASKVTYLSNPLT